ncbi:MAG: transposase [Pyrinomonadaceae bacterium]|nr:transposase [Pyrinomonadaceae bacterium]
MEHDEIYTRKNSLRLKEFDYSLRRVYFVTIVVEGRRNLFYNKQFGKEVVDCLLNLREELKFNLYGYCLMPNHFHALIGIGESAKDLGRICGAFKSLTTRIFWKYGEGKLWQRGFFDHIIRNETDFFECLKYTKENPSKKNLENWEFVGRVDYLR